jgi:hypothetical protein
VQLEVDYIAQNVTADTMQCHYDDGWGPSKNDPAGIEGLQDCLLDRYSLCAKTLGKSWSWFDFTACTYRNQKETDTITDKSQVEGFQFHCQILCGGFGYHFRRSIYMRAWGTRAWVV